MDGVIVTRKKRIFARRDNGRRVKLMLSLALVLSVALASFSAGYYVGTNDLGSGVVASAEPPIPRQFIY